MVKIQHKQTKVIEEISWHQWSTSAKYERNRRFWKIVDYGDPVDVYGINPKGKDKRLYTLDRDHAIRIIKGYPEKFYYKKHKIGLGFLSIIHRTKVSYLKGLEIIEKHPIIRTLSLIAILLTILSFLGWHFLTK